jgi:hypothetical protein
MITMSVLIMKTLLNKGMFNSIRFRIQIGSGFNDFL